MNADFRKPLPGTTLDWYDARAAVEALRPGAYATLSYTARVHAENIVRKAEPTRINDYLLQLIERREATLTQREQREMARGVVREKKVDEAYANWIRDIRARAYVEIRE